MVEMEDFDTRQAVVVIGATNRPDGMDESLLRSFFFFQAEDGIRDLTVTGVQTCALPISSAISTPGPRSRAAASSACVSASLLPREPTRISTAPGALDARLTAGPAPA